MIRADILVIGAGASGLMVAKELSAKGKKVIIIEARDRAGGRIDTLPQKYFNTPIETGAEFIHGNLPVTLQLLQENNIQYIETAGSMLHKKEGKWQGTEEEVEGWNEMLERMNKLEEDTTLTDFLNRFFNEEKYSKLRQSAIQYAQGFDVADENKASVMALRNEWQHEEEEQYRIPGGYMQLIDALISNCLKQHCEIHFLEPVKKIDWQKNKVVVTTASNEQFSAEKIIISVPVSILQNDTAIIFSPAIPEKIQAAKRIGFGSVIKVIIGFEKAFWKVIQKDALFFFSEEQIPTWWTQYPIESNILTGWLGGPKVLGMLEYSPRQILNIALQSLQHIFNQQLPLVTAWHVLDWQKEPYTFGAYSYNTVQSKKAKAVLKEPVENTIYFAGEAVYTGDAQGTVEAALVSGNEVAAQLLNIKEH